MSNQTTYTDASGQPWACRAEMMTADRAMDENRTERAIDAFGLRVALQAAEAAHAALVYRQNWAITDATLGLSGNPRRRAAERVRERYAHLLADSSRLIGDIRSFAREGFERNQKAAGNP